MSDEGDLEIKQDRPYLGLCAPETWTNVNPHEVEAFKHFSGGYTFITQGELDKFVYIAGIHGWTVTKTTT